MHRCNQDQTPFASPWKGPDCPVGVYVPIMTSIINRNTENQLPNLFIVKTVFSDW